MLAVDDSFTFGESVDDNETWPAFLEEQLRMPVLNAGVFGYGLDQIVLQADRLVPILRPEMLIVSFYFDSIFRNELSVRDGTAKPYFQLVEEDQLILKNSPVPIYKRSREIGLIRYFLGYSALVNYFIERFTPRMNDEIIRWWRKDTGRAFNKVHNNGREISCLLMGKLRDLSIEHNTPVFVMA